jgi:hypothetical protein
LQHSIQSRRRTPGNQNILPFINSTLEQHTISGCVPGSTPSLAILLSRSVFEGDRGLGRMLSLPRPMERINIVDMQFVGFLLVRESHLDGLTVSSLQKKNRTFAEVDHR